MTNKEIAEVLRRHVEDYQKKHPMFTADFHSHDCLCQRCLMDFVNVAARRLQAAGGEK